MIDKRVEYWNKKYLEYWQTRLKSGSSSYSFKSDEKPPDSKMFLSYYNEALKLSESAKRRILDVGVGFGRFIKIYSKNFDHDVWGTDISRIMIKNCKKTFPKLKDHFIISPAERQPSYLPKFSMVVCWSVFDATYQEDTLWEMQRLLEIGGVALISGKNTNYLGSDKRAIEAEIGARKNKHPNFFTRVKELEKNIFTLGFEIIRLYRFRRRGDWSTNSFLKRKEESYYQYVIILRKVKSVSKKKLRFKISDKFSETFRRKGG